MADLLRDPGPLPEVLEAEPVEQTMVIDPQTQLGVTANVGYSGLTGLAIRRGEVAVSVALPESQLDELLRLLGSTPLTVDFFHQVLARHQVTVDWFRRRGGYAWSCACLTDGADTYPDAEAAWLSAALHQAEQIAAALAGGEPA